MIKCEGSRVEIRGAGIDVMAELAMIVNTLADGSEIPADDIKSVVEFAIKRAEVKSND